VHTWLGVIAAVLVLNALFLALLMVAALTPAEALMDRAKGAFDTGSLSLKDYRPFDTRIGWHQYNDCLILQMVTNEDDVLRKSIGPLVYYQNDFREFCKTFSALLNNEVSPQELYSFRYTRYWHGHNAVTALMLYGFDFARVRQIFRGAAYLSLVGLAIVALWSAPHLRVLGLGIALFGALFWGLPYFAQSPSHGPGDTAVIIGFMLLLILARRGLAIGVYMAACGSFAAILVYLEFLTGLLPTAAAFLLPLGFYAAAHSESSRDDTGHRWHFAVAGILAFALGMVLTVAIKQMLAIAVFGWQAVEAFTNNLDYYVQKPATGLQNRLLVSVYTTLAIVYRWGTMLTYGNVAGAVIMFSGSVLAWIGAAIFALRARSSFFSSPFTVCAAGASLVFLWILILPTHTFNHSYMVRIMIAPLALGWVALWLQVTAQIGYGQRQASATAKRGPE
jgi:hypothetical protein